MLCTVYCVRCTVIVHRVFRSTGNGEGRRGDGGFIQGGDVPLLLKPSELPRAVGGDDVIPLPLRHTRADVRRESREQRANRMRIVVVVVVVVVVVIVRSSVSMVVHLSFL